VVVINQQGVNIMQLDLEHSNDTPAEMRLLAAVVGLAVKDTMLPPINTRNKSSPLDIADDAMSAFDFLFTPTSDAFLEWLDIDPPAFRKRLLDTMEDSSGRDTIHFKAMGRRNFRMNYRIWQGMYSRINGPVSDAMRYNYPDLRIYK
jgi:hypothetical protein